MSADLLWQVIGKNSAFIRSKANGKLFNAEPGHLTGMNSKSVSTICGSKTVALSVQKTGSKETILLEKRTPGRQGRAQAEGGDRQDRREQEHEEGDRVVHWRDGQEVLPPRPAEQGGGEVRAPPRLHEDEGGEGTRLALEEGGLSVNDRADLEDAGCAP